VASAWNALIIRRKNTFEGCQVIGYALKRTGDILLPFVGNRTDLAKVLASLESDSAEKRWFPLEHLLELFDIAERNDLTRRVGVHWAGNFLRSFLRQKDVQLPEQALFAISRLFPEFHRGDVGKIRVQPVDKHVVEVSDTTYAPCGYLSALMERTIAGYGAEKIRIEHPPKSCRKEGAPSCKYVVSWEENDLLRMRRKQYENTLQSVIPDKPF